MFTIYLYNDNKQSCTVQDIFIHYLQWQLYAHVLSLPLPTVNFSPLPRHKEQAKLQGALRNDIFLYLQKSDSLLHELLLLLLLLS